MIKEFKTLQELHEFERGNAKFLRLDLLEYLKSTRVWVATFTELNKTIEEVSND